MGHKLDRGLGLIRGDAFPLRRTIVNIPSGYTVTEAWLTVKSAYSDVDGSAIFQKDVTSSNVAGTGQVEDTGADGVAEIRFDLTTTNTEAVTAGTTYYYDIQIRITDGSVVQVVTLESGTAIWKDQVTRDT